MNQLAPRPCTLRFDTKMSDTTLHGKWLTIARALWVILAVLYVGTFLASVPLKLTTIPDFTSVTENVTQAEFLEGLTQAGVSPDIFIAYKQWLSVIVPFFYLVLAIFIFWRKSDDWMALLTSFVFLSFLGSFDLLVRVHPIWATVSGISNIVTSITLFLWFFTFPDGRFVPRWMRWLFFAFAATQVWRIFQSDAYQKSFPLLAPLIFAGILLSQIYRYRHANAAQRQQIKWVVFGIVVGTVPLLLFFVFYFGILNPQAPLERVLALNFFGDFLWEFFLLVLPISLTLAIFRSRLFDIDIIIRKTVTYALVVALLAIVYFGSVILLQQIFAALVNAQGNEFITVLSTLAIAVLFIPLRNRIQNAVDKRFYRKKYDAQQVLQKFSETVRDETDLEKLTGELLNVVNETMQPKSASVWLKKSKERQRE